MEPSSFVSRRAVLRTSALLAALPLLAACGAGGLGSNASSGAFTVVGSAAPAKTAAASATATTTASAASATTSAVSVAVISAAPGFTLVDPKSAKITGTFYIIQQKDWSDIHNTFLQNEVKAYAQQNGWQLDISYEAGFTGGSNFFQKMAAAIGSGTGPDFVWGNYDTFTLWNLKTLQPVDDVVNAAVKVFGQPTPGFAPGNKFDGKWYSVPYFNRSGGWWYRKSWLTDKNVDPASLKTFDDWQNASLTVSDPTKKMWGWGATVNRSGDGETDVATPWFSSGARLTDETGTKVLFNSELSIQAFTWLKDLYTNPKWSKMLPPGVNAWDDMGNNNAWYAGTIGFTSNAGTIFATSLKTQPAIGKDTYLAAEPAMTVGQKQTLINNGATGSTGSTLYLMQGAKNVDATKAMMQYLLSKDIQLKLFDTSQGYVNPAYTDWGWDTDPVKTCPNNVDLQFKANAMNPNAFAWFQPAPHPLLWIANVSSAVVMTDTMAAILKGTSVQDAVNDGQAKIESIRDKFASK